MFHEEKDTLNLLGSYSSRKEPIKTYHKEEKPKEVIREKIVYRDIGTFSTKQQKNNQKEYDINKYEYAGFWDRLLATILDAIIIYLPIKIIENIIIFTTLRPISTIILFEIFLPLIITIIFWVNKGATPGKLIMNMYIVDEVTGQKINIAQSIMRYIGYIPSTFIFGLGFIWIAVDEKNQGWHDKIGGTIVIKKKKSKEIELS